MIVRNNMKVEIIPVNQNINENDRADNYSGALSSTVWILASIVVSMVVFIIGWYLSLVVMSAFVSEAESYDLFQFFVFIITLFWCFVGYSAFILLND